MEQIKSLDFVNLAKESTDLTLQRKGRAVEAAQNQTSDLIWIVVDGAPANAMGWVETNTKAEQFINFDYIDYTQNALHTAKHESNHNKIRFWDIPVLERFSADHDQVIAKAINLGPVADSVALMEGFNENLTIFQVGVDPKVAYLYREVPAARALEKICKLVTGESLTQAYKSGSHKNFAEILQRLSDRLLLIDAITTPDYTQIERHALMQDISKHHIKVKNADHATEFVDELHAKITCRNILESLDVANDNDLSQRLAA